MPRRKKVVPAAVVESPQKGVATEDYDADVSQDGQTTDGTKEDHTSDLDVQTMEQQLVSLLGNKDILAQIQQNSSLCSLISTVGRMIECSNSPKTGSEEVTSKQV